MLRLPRFDPYVGCNFLVVTTAFIVGGFREVSGLEGTVKMTPYAEGGNNRYPQQFPGVVEWPNLVLSRGVIDSSAMWSWFDDVSRGNFGYFTRKTMIIMMLDRERLPVMYWKVKSTLPVKWSGPKLDSMSDHLPTESLELVHQGIEKPLPSKLLTLARAADDIARSYSPPYVNKRKQALDAVKAGVDKAPQQALDFAKSRTARADVISGLVPTPPPFDFPSLQRPDILR